MSDELVIYDCPACELASLIGDLQQYGHPNGQMGDQLACPRCDTPVVVEGFNSYVR